MIGTLVNWLAAFGDTNQRQALWRTLRPVFAAQSCIMLQSAGLVIKAGASAVVKGGAAFYAYVNGTYVTKAINTDMAALVGTVTNAKFNVYAFFIDAAGTLTSAMGTEAAAIGGIKFPAIPENKCLIGFILVNPTGTGNFVGGTTALDDATVVPNVVYFNATNFNGFDPTMLPGARS